MATVLASDAADTFNRPDSTTSLGNADTGQTWQVESGSVWGLSGNQAYNVSGGGAALLFGAAVPSCAQIAVACPSTSPTESLILRAVDTNNFLNVIVNDSTFFLYKKQAGGFSELASVASPSNVSSTVVLRGEVTPAGEFRGYRNGVLMLTYQLTAAEQTIFSASNATGVGMRSATSTALYDNITSDAAALSGSGGLSAAGIRVVPGSAALSGLGSAAATGIRIVLGAASLSGLGVISYPRLIFRPPVVDQPPLGDNRLFFRYSLTRGESVLKRTDGTYYTKQYPSQVEMEAAAIAYLGGHEHPVDFAEAEALIAAGYRAYLSP